MASLAFAATGHETGSRFTSFSRFSLGTGTLADVQKVLGQSPTMESGDAGEYEAKICYSTQAGDVSFLSGEMGGDEHDLLGFEIATRSAKPHCPSWPSSVKSPRLQLSGLHLGMSPKQFKAVVHSPIEWRGDTAMTNYSSRRPFSPAEFRALPDDVRSMYRKDMSQAYLDVDVTITGVFSRGQLVSITVWKVETS